MLGLRVLLRPVWNGICSLLVCPRTLMKSFMEKIPVGTVRKNHEMLPGGDLRSSNNLWVRSAWTHSELKVVPREKQIKMIFEKIDKKWNYVTQLFRWVCFLFPFVPRWSYIILMFFGRWSLSHVSSSRWPWGPRLAADDARAEWIREQAFGPHYGFAFLMFSPSVFW